MLQFFGGVELVDDSGDHIRLPAIEQRNQISSAGGSGRIKTSVRKGGGNLTIQFLAVCDNHHLRIAVGQLH